MIPATIESDIARGASGSATHRKLNNVLTIHYTANGKNIDIPFEPLISKYKDLVEAYIDEEELTEDEVVRYRYAPKQFSLDMYGTTGYWSLILFLNDCHSIIDFHPQSIKYIEKNMIESLIEEILALEA